MQTKTMVGFMAVAMLAGTSSMALAGSYNQNTSSWQDQSYGQNENYQPNHNGYGLDDDYRYGQNNRYGQGKGQYGQSNPQYGQQQFNGNQSYGQGSPDDNSNAGRRYGQNGRSGQGNQSSQNHRFSQNLPWEIRQKLQKEGYSDIQIEPGSYVVSANDSDGDPVLMMFGPDSAMMIRPINQNSSQTTGSGLHEQNRHMQNQNQTRYGSSNDSSDSSSDDQQ